MEKIKNLAFTFSCILTGSTIMAAIFISVFYEDDGITANTLWQIIFTSAVCCLGNFLYPEKKISKTQLYTLNFIHYLFVLATVIGGGLYFEWFYVHKLHMILGMFVSVTIVFLMIMYITYAKSKRDSTMLNEKLLEYQKKHHIS